MSANPVAIDQSVEYARGFIAEREGHDYAANPFPPHTTKSQAWAAGWLAAREHPLHSEP